MSKANDISQTSLSLLPVGVPELYPDIGDPELSAYGTSADICATA